MATPTINGWTPVATGDFVYTTSAGTSIASPTWVRCNANTGLTTVDWTISNNTCTAGTINGIRFVTSSGTGTWDNDNTIRVNLPKIRPQDIRAAENKSMRLLRQWLSEAEWNYLQEHDQLELPSQYEKDVIYIVKKDKRAKIVVKKHDKLLHELCIHPEQDLPTGDMMLANILLLKTDEKRFLATANKHQLAVDQERLSYWYVVIDDQWQAQKVELDPTWGGKLPEDVTSNRSRFGNVRTDHYTNKERKGWVWAYNNVEAYHIAREYLQNREDAPMVQVAPAPILR